MRLFGIEQTHHHLCGISQQFEGQRSLPSLWVGGPDYPVPSCPRSALLQSQCSDVHVGQVVHQCTPAGNPCNKPCVCSLRISLSPTSLKVGALICRIIIQVSRSLILCIRWHQWRSSVPASNIMKNTSLSLILSSHHWLLQAAKWSILAKPYFRFRFRFRVLMRMLAPLPIMGFTTRLYQTLPKWVSLPSSTHTLPRIGFTPIRLYQALPSSTALPGFFCTTQSLLMLVQRS